jgi:hypothetical protein
MANEMRRIARKTHSLSREFLAFIAQPTESDRLLEHDSMLGYKLIDLCLNLIRKLLRGWRTDNWQSD